MDDHWHHLAGDHLSIRERRHLPPDHLLAPAVAHDGDAPTLPSRTRRPGRASVPADPDAASPDRQCIMTGCLMPFTVAQYPGPGAASPTWVSASDAARTAPWTATSR